MQPHGCGLARGGLCSLPLALPIFAAQVRSVKRTKSFFIRVFHFTVFAFH